MKSINLKTTEFNITKQKRSEIKKRLKKLSKSFQEWEKTKTLNFKTFKELGEQSEAITYLIKEFLR